MTEVNYFVAAWSLVLNRLPLLSPYLTTNHWTTIAEIIVTSFLHGNGCSSKRKDEGEGIKGGDMFANVYQCLQAPWFQELPTLHESLVDMCLRHSATLLPKRYMYMYVCNVYMYIPCMHMHMHILHCHVNRYGATVCIVVRCSRMNGIVCWFMSVDCTCILVRQACVCESHLLIA